MSKSIKEVLETIDLEFDKKSLDWLISLYDGESGGFYYSASARDNEQFAPDIESVVQATACMQTLGLVPTDSEGKWVFPEWYKKGACDFLRSRQDPDDGYFYDPQYKATAPKDKIERNSSFALSSLRSDFYEKPLYPTAQERLIAARENSKKLEENSKNANTGLGVYETRESFVAWLNEISKTRSSYSWGSDLASADSMIRASGHMGTLVEWLKEKQNPETATWTEEFNMMAVNGVLKLGGFFNKRTEPYPNVEKYIYNVIELTKTFVPRTAAETWNPMGSLRVILENMEQVPANIKDTLDSSIAEMISNTTEKMRMFRQPDGGFGYLTVGSSVWSNSVVVSLGSPEGDVNAMALMMLTYNEAYRLTGTPRSHPWKKYYDYFWTEMKKRYDSYHA